jgi:hypothetical protein
MADNRDNQAAMPPARSLSVVIPSRTQPRQAEFLHRAVQSIKAQTIYSTMTSISSSTSIAADRFRRDRPMN